MVPWPGETTWIIPPQLHINLEFWFSAGKLATKTVGEPGTQGATIAGIQGCGFSTPGGGAAVAAATAGLAGELHKPKGKIFTIGLLSIMLAIGWADMTRLAGRIISVDGAAPKLHCSMAPPHTIKAIT
jgi:hypothetical protein